MHNRNPGQVLPCLLMLPLTLHPWPSHQEGLDSYVRGPNVVPVHTQPAKPDVTSQYVEVIQSEYS